MLSRDAAVALGREAFERGAARIPSLDLKLLDALRAAKVGEGIDPMKAWLRGWDAANLEAPVEA